LPADAAPALHLPSTDAESDRPAADPPPLPAVPGYEVLGELGRGGMGVVDLARHLGLGRPVALKMVLAGACAGPDELQRFRAEAEVAARLQHPNLVTVHEVGRHHGQPYFTLEYMGGGSLARSLGGQPLPAREAAALVAVLVAAVAHAHRHGVIHRDLKPANILLRRRAEASGPPEAAAGGFQEAAYEVKIADFGLAKRVGPGAALTASGAVLGTPSYMAPEQAAGKGREVGPAADVYALGAILYECLTGRPPFRAATAVDTLLQVLTAEPVPVRRLQPGVPRDLETVCLKCLERQPQRRYGSAAELADDLRRFLAGEPVRARPVRLPGRLLKWVNRQPLVAGLAGAVVAAVLAGLGVSAWGWLTAEQARQGEATQRGKAELAEGRALKLAGDEAVARAEEARQRAVAEAILYIRNVPLAQRELQAGRPTRALDLLNECPAAVRHWEWRYLKRQFDAGQQTLMVAPGVRTTGVAFSPDGRRLAVVCHEDVQIWDAQAGTEVRSLSGHKDLVAGAAFTPDGRQVVSASLDGEVRFWDAETGALRRTLNAPAGVVVLALSRDGKRLALADTRRVVTVWDAAAGKQLLALPAQPALITSVAFSPDGAHLAVGRQIDGRTLGQPTAALWEVATGKQALAFAAQYASTLALAFSPKGGCLAVGSLDHRVRVFDVKTGLLTPGGVLTGPQEPIIAVAFSPDGKQLAAGGYDHLVRVWDVGSAQELHTLWGHDEKVAGLAFSPDGRRLASAGYEGVAKVWDLAAGQGPTKLVPPGPFSLCIGVAFSRDGTQVMSAGQDRVVRLWDVTSGQVKAAYSGLGGQPWAVALSRDGRFAAAADALGTVKLWEASGRERFTFHPVAANRPQPVGISAHAALAFAAEGDRLVWADCTGAAAAWDTATGRELFHRLGSGRGDGTVALDGHGERLAWSSGDTIHVRGPADPKDSLTLSQPVPGVLGLAFDPTGRYLASAAKELRLWELGTGRHVQAFGGQGFSTGEWLAFSPDGRRLVTASWQVQAMHLWDVPEGRELLSLPGHQGVAGGLGFSPDGRRLAAAGNQGLKVFDAPPTPEVVRRLIQTTVTAAAVSPDGKWVASTEGGPFVAVWERATGRPTLLLPWSVPGAALDRVNQNLPFSLAFSPDGTRLAVGGGKPRVEGKVQLWDVSSRQLLHTLGGHGGIVFGVAFSPDGAWLASASHDKTARVWNVATGKELLVLKEHTDRVNGVAFHPGGQWLATGSRDRTVRIWDAGSGRMVQKLEGHQGSVAGVAYRPDGAVLAAATANRDPTVPGEVVFWDPASGQRVRTLQAAGWLLRLAFRPDGRLLAAAGDGRVIHLWDSAGREVLSLRGHDDMIMSLSFSGDGQFLVSCGMDRTARVWDLNGLAP
jgi:WD40 repeat protein